MVLATVSHSGSLGADSDGAAAIAELERLGLARIIELDRYGLDEVDDALDGADEAVAEDLLTLGDGDPDRIATLFDRWEDASVVTREGTGWAYASEREAARGRSGIDIRRELLLSFTPPDDPASVAGYERAVATLGVAALEGMVFTVAALARVLDEDEEELSDRLDDHLVFDDDHRRPLDGSGCRCSRRRLASLRVPGPAALGRAPSLHLEPPRGAPLRRSPRDRLRAVLDRGDRGIWDLAQLAGDEQDLYFSSVANVFATVQDHLRVLEAEAATPEDGDPRAAVASVRRLVRHMDAAGPALDGDARLRYASLARSRLQTGESVLAEDRRARAWIDVYDALAAAARAHGWYADGARCDALSLGLEADPVVASRRALSLAERLLEQIAQDAGAVSIGAAAHMARRRQRNARDARDRPAPQRQAVIEGLPEEIRSHDEHTCATQARCSRRSPATWARRSRRDQDARAAGPSARGRRTLRALTYFSLANHLEAAGDREGAIAAARSAVDTAPGGPRAGRGATGPRTARPPDARVRRMTTLRGASRPPEGPCFRGRARQREHERLPVAAGEQRLGRRDRLLDVHRHRSRCSPGR